MSSQVASRRVLLASRSSLPRSKPAFRPRYQSTQPPPAHTSHVAAGVAGGAAVLVAGYGWYHFSGAKTAVNSLRSVTQTAKDMKNKAVDITPDPKVALGWLRSASHSYAAAIPGGAYILDQTFDQLEKLADTHGDEVKKIIGETYSDIKSALDDAKGKDIGDQVSVVIQKGTRKIQQLANQANKDYIGPLLDKSPELKKALEGSSSQLQSLAKKHGPKAQKIADDTMKQIKEISEQGLTGTSIAKIVLLVQSKSKEIAQLAQETGKDAYAEAEKQIEPMMNNLPDIKKLLDENLSKMEGVLGQDGVKKVKDMYAELEKLQENAKGKDPATLAKEAKDLIQKRMGDIQGSLPSGTGAMSAAAGSLGSLGSLPGLSKLTDDLPALEDLKTVVEKHGQDGEKLLKSTYEEIKSVLEKKGEEAKKLAGKAKDDAKSKA